MATRLHGLNIQKYGSAAGVRGECKNFRASGIALFHPHGWAMAHAVVLQPSHCHLTWQGFSRLGAATLPITLPISITAHSLRGTSPFFK